MQLEQISYVYICECEWNENMNGELAKHRRKRCSYVKCNAICLTLSSQSPLQKGNLFNPLIRILLVKQEKIGHET